MEHFVEHHGILKVERIVFEDMRSISFSFGPFYYVLQAFVCFLLQERLTQAPWKEKGRVPHWLAHFQSSGCRVRGRPLSVTEHRSGERLISKE